MEGRKPAAPLLWGHFGGTLGALWGHFGGALGARPHLLRLEAWQQHEGRARTEGEAKGYDHAVDVEEGKHAHHDIARLHVAGAREDLPDVGRDVLTLRPPINQAIDRSSNQSNQSNQAPARCWRRRSRATASRPSAR
eukprot:981185-Prymnesium_polylepis.1